MAPREFQRRRARLLTRDERSSTLANVPEQFRSLVSRNVARAWQRSARSKAHA